MTIALGVLVVLLFLVFAFAVGAAEASGSGREHSSGWYVGCTPVPFDSPPTRRERGQVARESREVQ